MDLHPRIRITVTYLHILIVNPREDTDVPNLFSYYNVNESVVISVSHRLVLILGFMMWKNWIYSQEFNGWTMICLLVIMISACIQLGKQKGKN